jgi:autophagy-related protein 9
MKLRDSNPNTARNAPGRTRLNGLFSKQRMDAHDIANRIMRKDNYFIAMIDRNVLDLSIPIPFLNRPILTRTLEWNINLCILKYVFDEQGQLRQAFITDQHRRLLSDGYLLFIQSNSSLRRRFLFAGFMNVILAPFIVIYLLLLYFFRYFEEYHKNPGALGSKQYKPFAQWKFREFNELYHIFKKRIDFSHKFASKYIDQFPKEKTAQISSFIAFVSGSFAAVLFLVSLVDPELFLGFEITKDRTVLFYLGLFGTILAVSRGMIPEENLVFEPEAMLNRVIAYTHYYPDHWVGKLHSDEVCLTLMKLMIGKKGV